MPRINPAEFTGKALERFKADPDAVIRYFEGIGFTVGIERPSYRVPILLCLLEMGGRRHHSEVLECVKIRMTDFMSDYEYEILHPDPRERWKVQASGAASDLRKKGLIADSPGDVWELTDKGRQEALKHREG